MAKLNPKVGERFLWQGKEVTVEEVAAHTVIAHVQGADGVVRLKHADLETFSAFDHFNQHEHMLIPSAEWNRLVNLRNELAVVSELQSGKRKGVQVAAGRFGISERQIFRYLKIYKENPSPMALRAVKRGRPAGAKFLGIECERLIEECIEKYYLKREKPSVAKLHEDIRLNCINKGVKPPCMKSVRARVVRLDLEIRIQKREGSKRAKEVCKGVPNHTNVDQILERIEIDHTLVDVILRADSHNREVIGRPWLTVAMDCKSRMVIGFYIGFERPSASSVAACLAMAAMPKEQWLKSMGVDQHWPAQGMPKQIWVDNAMEFRSEALRRGCERHGILLQFRPVGSPEMGGMIERLIGTLMGEVHLLPGTTQSNVIAKGDYDAEARAVMTLSEFIPWFSEQIVSGYHLRLHRALQLTPLQAWQRDAESSSFRVPPDLLEYYTSFLPGQKRKLTRTGVSLNGVNYWSSEFSAWIGQNKSVLAHYHQMDIGRVYVRLPDGRITVALAQDRHLQKLSLSDYRRRRAGLRELARDPGLARQAALGFQRNEERLVAAQHATRTVKRGDTRDHSDYPDEMETVDRYSPRPLRIVPGTIRQPLRVLMD